MRKNQFEEQQKLKWTLHFSAFELRVRAILLAGAVPLLLVLAACSGGGGSKSAAPSPATVRDNVNPNLPGVPQGWETDPDVWAAHPEFQNQSGLDKINAQEAYALGVTGKDVTIGFVDTGLDDSHNEFSGKRIRLNDHSGLDDADDGQLRHGTGVASVALGARDNDNSHGMHGVAFDADPAMWSLNLDDGYLDINDDILTSAIIALEGAGARIINHSWGYSTALDPSLHRTQTEFLQSSYGDALAQMRQRQSIHIWAAGNDSGDQIAVSSAWPVLFADLAGYSISVAALGADGKIGRISNRCGVARNHCLAAPGGVAVGGRADTLMATSGGGYRTAFGTSYAAPYVSGVLALMMQAFGDQLSLPEYTARLFATANKQGVYADEAIYGQGLVDAAAALRPHGNTRIPLPTGGLAGTTERAITDGDLPREMIERLKREKIIILDDLNTPFTRPLIANHDHFQSFQMTEWLTTGENKTSPKSHPFLHRFAAAQEGKIDAFWTFVPVVLRKKSIHNEKPDRQGLGFSARRTRRRSRLELGVVGEENSLMASAGMGALQLGPSHSVLVSYGYDVAFGDLKLNLDAHGSFSSSHGAADSLVRGTRGAVASAFSVTAAKGKMLLELGQPTFFEAGHLHLSLPYRRNSDGDVFFKLRQFDLNAGQRPIEMKLLFGDAAGQAGLRIEKRSGLPAKFNLGYKRRF